MSRLQRFRQPLYLSARLRLLESRWAGCSRHEAIVSPIIIGIVIERWKLAIFKRRLKAGGFSWTQHNGPIPDTWLLKVTTLKVVTSSADKLGDVIKAANAECSA